MKNLFYLACVIFLFSCNNEEKKSTEATVSTQTPEVNSPETKVDLPYKFSYDATPVVVGNQNTKIVMDFNKDFADGKTDNIGSYFADSVHLVFADGSEFNGIRDSAVAMATQWRKTISDIQLSYIAAMAIDNKANGDQWVFQWVEEVDNYKDGKKHHEILHEDYRLVNGKIREVLQYSQAVPANAKK